MTATSRPRVVSGSCSEMCCSIGNILSDTLESTTDNLTKCAHIYSNHTSSAEISMHIKHVHSVLQQYWFLEAPVTPLLVFVISTMYDIL